MGSALQRQQEARIFLTESARAVLRLLSRSGPMTRPRLGERLQLSKPTMSAAIAELEAHGLVIAEGIARGATGRSAIRYALGPGAGFVIGVDAGTTHLHAIASRLDRRVLARTDRKLQPGNAAQQPARIVADIGALIADMMGSLHDAQVNGPPAAVALAVPAIVSSAPQEMRRQEFRLAAENLTAMLNSPVLLENNVNCAALAELHAGAARDVANFIYLQIGVKIGLGIVVDRRIYRGFRGAAGEVARLPFPWAEDRAPAREGLERYLGSAALMRRCREAWPAGSPAPRTAKELFHAAELPGVAREQVEHHAVDIGRMVAGLVGILDPGLVVLGGGVGRNAILLPAIADTVADLAWPTEMRISELTDDGTATGAVELAAGYRLARLLGELPEPACIIGEAG